MFPRRPADNHTLLERWSSPPFRGRVDTKSSSWSRRFHTLDTSEPEAHLGEAADSASRSRMVAPQSAARRVTVHVCPPLLGHLAEAQQIVLPPSRVRPTACSSD